LFRPVSRVAGLLLCVVLGLSFARSTPGGVGGRISGTVKDASGSVVPKATVSITNPETGTRQTLATDEKGVFAFLDVQVGRYELEIVSSGFKPYQRKGIVIDADSALLIDAVLEVGGKNETVTVDAHAVQVETSSTQLGEVITGQQMTAVPLNGRSFTDLLALQPGVAPETAITSLTVQDVGAATLSPSGNLNPGTVAINGQREFANSFIVNGSDSEEDVNNGTAIVPNLDSIAEFRILTSNFDAEYGEFSVRVSAEYQSGCPKFFLKFARPIRSEPVRRYIGRPYSPEQDFFLCRLSGNAADRGNRHGSHWSPFGTRAIGEFFAGYGAPRRSNESVHDHRR
jgi:Carboxypeptidase regulatory-like domain